ncbi:4Fe-4S binding protein [Desulfobacterales bacterium HSG17]|nr:4Fe-4S binding protein [Desulfobacterales bacterium HSG17]
MMNRPVMANLPGFRIIRILISCIMLFLFFLVFLGDEKISGLLSQTLLSFQFVPSLIRFFINPAGILSFSFFLILLLNLVFGRVYCSFLCPLGMLQDLFIFISRKAGVKKKHAFQTSSSAVQYSLLGIIIVSVIFGSLSIVNILDPYSLFGKFSAHLFKSAALFVNNIFVNLFEMFDIYILHIRKLHEIPISILIFTIISLCIVFLFSIFRGRLYCNMVCPVGAVLGLISRVSFFNFSIEDQKCKSCRLCEHVCKAGCLDIKNKTIDNSRCIACFNCLDVCYESAVKYLFQMPVYRPACRSNHAQARRIFLLSAVAGIGTALADYSPVSLIWARGASGKDMPITPPGSLSIKHFTKTCTSCHLCVSVCPTNVITPSLADYGISGLMQPKMNFRKGHCDFSCNACGIVCPTGAISRLLPDEKKQVQIGTVSLNKKKCIVHVKKKHCGACGEACPANAISPVQKDRVLFPKINKDFCIGCGACEHACPTHPKAIFITANPVHKQAVKYAAKDSFVQDGISDDKGFPF